MCRVISSLCLFFICYQIRAQDPQFTQFYGAPLYLNPAFAGSILDTRASLQYRNQWIGLESPYSTIKVAFDRNSDALRGGYGMYFINDRIGTPTINRSEMAFLYSKEIDLSSTWKWRLGANGSMVYKFVDPSGLVFGDQINNRNSAIGQSSEQLNFNSKFFPDLGLGSLLFTDQIWLGISAHHLLFPNQSIIQGVQIPTPVKLSIHGGFKKQLGGGIEEHSFSPCFQVKYQGLGIQSDVGLYYHRNFLLTGFWYRGIPFLSKEGAIQQDAFAWLVGFKSELLTISYSYDLPLTRMIYSTGSHEIVLQYEFDWLSDKKPRIDRKRQKLPCPRF